MSKKKTIQNFIKSLNCLSDQEIFDMFENFAYSEYVESAEEIDIQAVRCIKDINLKIEFIKREFFYEFDNKRSCWCWNHIIESISDLDNESKTYILNNLFLNQSFGESTQLLNIPTNLKFGVELEYFDVYYDDFCKLFKNNNIETIMEALGIPSDLIKQIKENSIFEEKGSFNNWVFYKETMNERLPEAASPIMINTPNCLNQIKAVSLLFKVLYAKINDFTALHINIGADYFGDNTEALKYLLLIWSECEELFYKIANEEGKIIRKKANVWAKPIKGNIQKTLKNKQKISLETEDDFTTFIYNVQVRDRLREIISKTFGRYNLELSDSDSYKKCLAVFKQYQQYEKSQNTKVKHTSINFNHMTWGKQLGGRMEFRIFNNSLDYEIIMQNILLIGKLIETSLLLANNNEDKRQKLIELLAVKISEEKKLTLLLNLLFDNDNEKEIFKKRWSSVKSNPSYNTFYTGRRTFIKEKTIHPSKKQVHAS